MANIIIGIHGLGNKPSSSVLCKWWRKSMTEGLRANNFKTSLPEFEMVYWADILHEEPLNLREKDIHNPLYLEEKYVKASPDFTTGNHNTRKKVVDFLKKQAYKIFLNNDLSLNYSFISDTLINRYFKDLEAYYTVDCVDENDQTCRAQIVMRNHLLKVLEKHKDKNIMLISHSMGSIIAFDVLTFMASHIKIHTLVTLGSPLGLPVVISKIAAEQREIFHELKHMKTPPGVTNNWFNFSDITDKVAFEYELTRKFGENENGVKPIDFLVTNNYEINGVKNPHKSFGYLRTPEFAKILNEFILIEKLTVRQRVTRKVRGMINSIKLKKTN
ncbi:MAG: hypothetical protein GXO79_01945 [Chlorobi bacterium]|nr:hypothetical protein [Chlorobiota bacterium]